MTNHPTAGQLLIAMNGARVRLIRTIDCYPTGIFEAGLTGTVEQVDITGSIVAMVKLDKQFDALNEWDNCLQVGTNPEEHISTLADYELTAT